MAGAGGGAWRDARAYKRVARATPRPQHKAHGLTVLLYWRCWHAPTLAKAAKASLLQIGRAGRAKVEVGEIKR